VDQGVQTVVIVAMALLVLVLSTTDLSIDLLRLDADRLPPWLANLTQAITNGRESEGVGQRQVRRIIEGILIVLAVASPAYILTRPGADVSAITWSVALWLTALVWLLWLMRRPRRPVPGSAEAAKPEINRAAGRAGGKGRRKRR
jgi:hypothetical protein